jgi:hypothetical protein
VIEADNWNWWALANAGQGLAAQWPREINSKLKRRSPGEHSSLRAGID